MSTVRETHIVYTIQPGDTLYRIALQFGSSVEAIQQANLLQPPFTDLNLIYPGWVILIPAPSEQPFRTIYITAPGDTLFQISQRFSAHPELIAGVNQQIENPDHIYIGQPLWVPAFVYEVQQGDTLSAIARQLQIPLSHIIAANEGRPAFSLDLILTGYQLLIPLPSSRNIAVIRPLPGSTIQSGVHVEGFARVFEANVLFMIYDDNGVIVSNERFTTALVGAPAYSYFAVTLPFDQNPTSQSGEIWVYARSAEDNRIIDLVQVRVSFL